LAPQEVAAVEGTLQIRAAVVVAGLDQAISSAYSPDLFNAAQTQLSVFSLQKVELVASGQTQLVAMPAAEVVERVVRAVLSIS